MALEIDATPNTYIYLQRHVFLSTTYCNFSALMEILNGIKVQSAQVILTAKFATSPRPLFTVMYKVCLTPLLSI